MLVLTHSQPGLAPLEARVPSSQLLRLSPRRGAAKTKIDGPPRAFAKSQTHPPAFRFFVIKKNALLDVGKESSKTPKFCFTKKSMSKAFSKTRQNFAWEFKKTILKNA
jgi:hypothetical protein